MNVEPEAIEGLEAAIGYSFQDKNLLLKALTHASYRNENRDIDYDNERLEFLGDSVLGVLICTRLLTRFPKSAEGVLSRYKARLVSEHGLSLIADVLSLGDYLHIGRGELMGGGRSKTSLLANATEALIAAVYLDGGFSAADTLIDRLFSTRLDEVDSTEHLVDFKTRLQELSQSSVAHDTPTYSIVSITGPDHHKSFEAAVHIAGKQVATGVGFSKKEAEQAAAKEALLHLGASTID